MHSGKPDSCVIVLLKQAKLGLEKNKSIDVYVNPVLLQTVPLSLNNFYHRYAPFIFYVHFSPTKLIFKNMINYIFLPDNLLL